MIRYSSRRLIATNAKYKTNITSARPMFIFHLKIAIDIMTNRSIRKRMTIEQAIPELLTLTGPKIKADRSHGKGRLQIEIYV